MIFFHTINPINWTANKHERGGATRRVFIFLLYLKVERSFKVTGGEGGVERWLSRWKCMSLLQRIWWVPNTHTGWLATCNPKGSDTSIWPPRACVCTCTCAHTHTHTHTALRAGFLKDHFKIGLTVLKVWCPGMWHTPKFYHFGAKMEEIWKQKWNK